MRTIVLAIGLLFFFTAQSQQGIVYAKDPFPGFAFGKIAKEQLAADIRFWHKVMEESHVNLYHAISKEALEQKEKQLLLAIGDSISQTEAVLLFGKLAALLNEGHIGMPSSSVTDSMYTNSLRFPFLLQKVTDTEWIVSRDLSSEQKLGVNAVILEVNGKPVSELNQQFREYYGGLEIWRKQQIAIYVRKLLFLHGMVSPYRIKARTETGQIIDFTIPGYSKQQADSLNKVLAASVNQPAEPYTFTLLPDNIAYINYRQMVNSRTNPFSDFLKTSFTKIKEANAAGLIIDLRGNGGGNSSLGDSLISYFSTKPYVLSGGMKWKSSSHYKAYLKLMDNVGSRSENQFYNSLKEGDMYTYVNRDLRKPVSRELTFTGKTAVLIGPDTFSSANMLSDGIKSFQLATLFGEPTGEPGNDFGEMYNFMLPNTHIIARASTKMFTRADGDENNFDPIMPDITVKPTPKDLKEKRDVVLETAVNWIRKQ
ncbi:MAG TPA: S41 family peptidase [Sediminibacterium sp.]